MKLFLTRAILFYIAFSSLVHSSQAPENTIKGYWFASGSIIEIKICEEFICAEIVHVITEEGLDPLTVLDENNAEEELRKRTLIGVNVFDGFAKRLFSNTKLEGGRTR